MPKELCFHMISYRLSNPETLPEDRREIPGVSLFSLLFIIFIIIYYFNYFNYHYFD